MSNNGGLSLAINQVEYGNSPDGPVVYIFGRDHDGVAHQIEVTGFRPYFYAPLKKVDSLPLIQRQRLIKPRFTPQYAEKNYEESILKHPAMSAMSVSITNRITKQTFPLPPGT